MPIVKTYYKVHRVFPDPDYFYLENTSGETISFVVYKQGSPLSTDLSYSLDKSSWTDIHDGGTISDVTDGTKVYFRSSTGLSSGEYSYYRFSSQGSKPFDAGGHISTLINYLDWQNVTSIPNYGLCYMFSRNSGVFNGLVHADIDFYGIHTIGDSGLLGIFQNIETLISIPDFSSIVSTGYNAFRATFLGCTSLQTPADFSGVTEMNTYGSFGYCYSGCTLLTEAITPNISTWSPSKFTNWLSDTAATGVVRKPAGLTIPTDNVSGVPTGWTTENY